MVYKKGPLLHSFGHDQHLRISPSNTKPGRPSESIVTEQDIEEESDVEDAMLPRGPDKGAKREKRRLFGMPRDKNPGFAYILPEDYDKRYPPDEYGQEIGPNARVWRVYLDEAELNDRDMVEGWKDGVDVLLVFAGLFSAVVTTFVTQTSQKLDQDFGQVAASLLNELVAFQRSQAAGSPLNSVSPSKLDLSSPPQYSNSDAWVNGLWFTSLALSLVTALYAVLIKQWVQYYISFISGTPQERARIHHFRYMGIQRWSVPAIIGVLPVLLYAALFLFILGLVVFLQALKLEIAYPVGAIGSTAFVLYIITNALPVFFSQCPYRTPLIEHVRSVVCYTVIAVRRFIFPLSHGTIPRFLLRSWAAGLRSRFRTLGEWCKYAKYKQAPSYKIKALKTFESKEAEKIQDEVVLEAVHWLLASTSNPSVKSITIQSTSGLRLGFSRIGTLAEDVLFQKELFSVYQSFVENLEDLDIESFIGSPLFYATERTLRASMAVGYETAYFSPWLVPITQRHLEMESTNRKQDIVLQHALVTFVIFHAAQCAVNIGMTGIPEPDTAALDVIPTLVKVDEYPLARYAWFKSLQFVDRTLKDRRRINRPERSFACVHSWLKPFFEVLLEGQRPGNPGIWREIIPFVCRALPSDIVGDHGDFFGHLPDSADPKMRWSWKVELCLILTKGLIKECKSEPNGAADLENIIRAIMFNLSLLDNNDQLTAAPLAAVAELCDQPFFANCAWSSKTYSSIFSAYIQLLYLFGQQHVSFQPWTPTPLQYLSNILSNKECASGLIQSICYRSSFSYYDSAIVTLIDDQIMPYLSALNASDPLVDNVIDCLCVALRCLDGMPSSQAATEGPAEMWNQQPATMQPLVRWILEQTIARDKKEKPHPTAQEFVTGLAEHAGILTFICSSFFIDLRYDDIILSFGEESHVLLLLATHNKDRSSAADVWQGFLSWVVTKSADLDIVRYGRGRNKESCEQYVRMADFVDELVSTLGLDGSELKLPRYAWLSTDQENGIVQSGKLEGPSTHPARHSNVFRKLICWKAHPDADEEIGLESNKRVVAEEA